MNRKQLLKLISCLCLVGSLQMLYVPQAEAGFFGGLVLFPIKTAKKVVQTTGEGAVRVGGSVATKVGKEAGKEAIREANPAKKIKRAKRMAKRAKKTGRVAYRIYGKFDGR